MSTLDNCWITAVHEAAHAVAAVRTGLVFDVVSAIPDEEREFDGALDWLDLHTDVEIQMPPEALALVLLAGPCAEAQLRGLRFDRVFSGVGAMDDRASIANLHLSPEQFLQVSRDAVAFVDEDWTAIERVAEELPQLHGIASLYEARAYLAHPVLGVRLRECVRCWSERLERRRGLRRHRCSETAIQPHAVRHGGAAGGLVSEDVGDPAGTAQAT